MKILTANQQFSVEKFRGYVRFVERMVGQRWNIPVDWSDPQGEVHAEIVRSSWRVSCPFCSGAMVIEPNELYYCPDCVMQANEFRPMTVIWPKNRRAIESVLLKRPDPMRRNWLPHETIKDLRRENKEHGIGE